MKHFYLALTVLMACVLASCNKFESEIQPLVGNDRLNTFTVLADNGETILTGVANPQSGFVVVEPAEYISVSGDQNVVICKTQTEKYHVFKLNGEKLGIFDTFTHWTESADYYLGSKYDLQVYYFPKYDTALTISDSLNEADNMLFYVDGKWQIRDNFGKCLWEIPSAFTLIRDANSRDKIVIAIADKHSTVLYDCSGKKLKKLSAARWKKLQNQLQDQKGHQGGAAEAEVADLHKFL